MIIENPAYRFGKKPGLLKCDCNAPAELVRVIARNGVTQFKLICTRCGKRGGYIISPKILSLAETGARIDRDHTDQARDDQCSRCGATERIEWHHIAPWHIFGSVADEFPTVPLCQPCHAELHRSINEYYQRKAT